MPQVGPLSALMPQAGLFLYVSYLTIAVWQEGRRQRKRRWFGVPTTKGSVADCTNSASQHNCNSSVPGYTSLI